MIRPAKCIRTRMPPLPEGDRRYVTAMPVKSDRAMALLQRKLHEEAEEVAGARTREELTEELGDLRQVMVDICVANGIDWSEVLASGNRKFHERGGFLDEVECSEKRRHLVIHVLHHGEEA